MLNYQPLAFTPISNINPVIIKVKGLHVKGLHVKVLFISLSPCLPISPEPHLPISHLLQLLTFDVVITIGLLGKLIFILKRNIFVYQF